MKNNDNDVIVRFCGRMANQMFQWAFGRAYEQTNGIMPVFDNSQETLKLNHFNLIKEIKTVKKPLINIILRKIVFIRNLRNKLTKLNFDMPIVEEEMFCKYQPELLENKAPVYLQGFFQTEKYFSNIKEQLLKDFSIKERLNSKNKAFLDKIKSTNSVSVHFRRGDYLKARVANTFGGCSTEYYKNAVEIIAKKSSKPITIFVFSDDIKWVKENVNFGYNTVYVDANSGKQGYFDLELMKNCKHNIIANSSFSWWGAWLNTNEEKIVIAPKVWMKTVENDFDIIPNSWIRIDN